MMIGSDEESQPLIEYSSFPSLENLHDVLSININTDPDFEQVNFRLNAQFYITNSNFICYFTLLFANKTK